MFFELSKIVWAVVAPHRLVPLLLLIGVVLLWTPWRRTGRFLATLAIAVVLATGVVPVGDYLLAKLENRFPQPADLPERVDGIVSLGGVINQHITLARGQLSLNDSVERLTEFAALARHYPGARLVYSGGSGMLTDQSVKEADALKPFIARLGIDPARVIFENQSRNTWENAVFSKELAKPKPEEVWLLVTSASHMPRAMGCFRKAGWRVIPYPVDFQYGPSDSFGLGFRPLNGLWNLSSALQAWVGLGMYWLTGRTDALFPAPDAPV